MAKKNLVRMLLLICLLGLLLAPLGGMGCGQKSPLTIGYCRKYSSLPLKIAEENDYFEMEGVDVTLEAFDGDVELWQEWERGKLSGVSAGIGGCVNARAKGSDPVIVMFGAKSVNSGIAARSGTGSISDLVGKRIGVKYGTEEHYLLEFALELNGIKDKAMQVLDITMEQGPQLLATGDLDAWVGPEPELSKAALETGGTVIFTAAETAEFMVYQLTFDYPVTTSRRDDVVGVIRAWFRSIDFIEESPGEARRLSEVMLKGTHGEMEELSEGVSFYTMEDETNLVLSPDPFKWLGRVEYALEYQGLVEPGFDITGMINLDFTVDALTKKAMEK